MNHFHAFFSRIGLCMAASVASAFAAPDSTTHSTRPNLIVILADDLGWNDLSIHGSKTPTPNIDRLAANGIEVKNLIVNSVCSPTRAAFYTGRDAVRSGYGGEVGDRLNPNFRTIAHSFKAAGYTTGLFGKWHNGRPSTDKRGSSPNTPTPMAMGFETFKGFYGGGTDFFTQRRAENDPRNWFINEQQTEGVGFTTDLIANDAIQFITEAGNKPFFAMLAHAAPHEPFEATDALLKRVPKEIRGNINLTQEEVLRRNRDPKKVTNPQTWEYGGFTEAERKVVYSAMLIGLDDAVGQLLAALKKNGQDKNTAILFFSDNGAMHYIREGNLPLRGWKHELYEGGIHTPCFLTFPGRVPQGKKFEPMVRVMDLYPTLASLVGVPVEGAKDLDGVDLSATLLGKAQAPDLEFNGIFIRFGCYRDNKWKLIARADKDELYDITKDISESQDVADKYPDVAKKLRAKHDAWLKARGANLNYTVPTVEGTPTAEPKGEVLEVAFNATAKKEKQQFDIPLRRAQLMKDLGLTAEDFCFTPGDRLVYDMKIESMVPGQAAWITVPRAEANLMEVNGPGINWDGKHIAPIKELPAPLNQWKRYVVGIGGSAAVDNGSLRMVVQANVPGEIRVVLDNIQVLKPTGKILPMWDGGKAPDASKSALKVTSRKE